MDGDNVTVVDDDSDTAVEIIYENNKVCDVPVKRKCYKWSKVEIMSLLKYYKGKPCLWNLKHNDHYIKRKTILAWETVLRKLDNPLLTVRLVKKKIQCLLSDYHIEREKELRDPMYKPLLFYYKFLFSFLKENEDYKLQKKYAGIELRDLRAKPIYKWSNKDKISLLKYYKEQRCLWDIYHKDYNNKYKSTQAWKSIQNQLGGGPFTLGIVKTEMASLLTTYRSERVKKLKDPMFKSSEIYTFMNNFFKDIEDQRNVIINRENTPKVNDSDIGVCQMSLKLSRPNILKLLELYKEQQCLWNKKHSDYKAVHKRYLAWKSIQSNLSVKEGVIETIAQLRTQYTIARESKALNSKYNLPYWYHSMDSFLSEVKAEKCKGYVWTNENLIKLIRSYKEHQCLWNINHRFYKDMTSTSLAWKSIQLKLRFDLRPTYLPLLYIKRKIVSMRHWYCSIRRQLLTCPNISKPVWYQIMDSFLGAGSSTRTVNKTTQPAITSSDNSEHKCTNPCNKIKLDILLQEEDEFDLFGRIVAVNLRNLPVGPARVLEQEIYDLVNKYRNSEV